MMINIDGSQKSGSGTILRLSIVLSALLGEDLHIWNIRARRGKPGLRPQHVQVVRACQQLCGGRVEGAEAGSMEVTFRPGKSISGGEYRGSIGTGGSTTMMASALLPLGVFADKSSKFSFSGGLFQDFAPSPYHFQHVFLPAVSRTGVRAGINIIRPGYVPRGQGVIDLNVAPALVKLRPFTLREQGKIVSVKGIAISSHLAEQKVSERLAAEFRARMEGKGYPVEIQVINDATAAQKGAALAVWAETDTGCIIGFDQAGKPGRRSEDIGSFVARNLLEELDSGATVDRYLADQIVLYGALADGVTEYIVPKMTEHVEANLWLVEKVLGARTHVSGNRVRIEGVGFERK